MGSNSSTEANKNDTTEEVNRKTSIPKDSSQVVKNTKSNDDSKESKETSMEFWMTNLPKFLKQQPFINLAIPGTHNSMTYLMTSSCSLAPDAEPGIVRWKFFGKILRYIMVRWSQNQIHNLEEQLKFGVRYFDFRVTTKEESPEFHFAHGLYCGEVAVALKIMKSFLDTHPEEIVVIDFQHFYAFSKNDHTELVQILLKTFDGKLVPYLDHMQDLNLEYMSQNGHQVLIVYRSCYASIGEMLLWPSKSFPTPWHNTVSIQELLTSLEDGIKERNRKIGFVSQCVLTPDADFVKDHLFSTFKKWCVLPLTKKMYEWFDNLSGNQELSHGINVIIADYVGIDDNRFTKAVVNLNTKKYDNFMHLK